MSKLARVYFIYNTIKILKAMDLVKVREMLEERYGGTTDNFLLDKVRKIKAEEIEEFAKGLNKRDIRRILALAIEYIVSYVYDYETNSNYKDKEWDFMVGERKLDLKIAWFRECPDEEKEIEYDLRPLDILVDFREDEFQLLETVVRDFRRENIESVAKRFNELIHYELGLEYDIIRKEKSLDTPISRL